MRYQLDELLKNSKPPLYIFLDNYWQFTISIPSFAIYSQNKRNLSIFFVFVIVHIDLAIASINDIARNN